MRDKLRDKSYFEKYLTKNDELLISNEKALLSGEVAESKVERAKYRNFSYRLNSLVAKYSKGDPVDSLKESIVEIIKCLPDESAPINTKVKKRVGKETVYLDKYMVEPYERMLRLLSLAYLLDVSDTDFKTIVGVIDRDNITDNLYEFIIRARFRDRIPKKEAEYDSKSVILKVYRNLQKAVIESDPSKAEKYVYDFLEQSFYHKHAGFYDFHKSKIDLYYGYWSFESAVVVKILNLDESGFKDHQYYPKDLVN